MVSSYSNRRATFDANQKTIITSIFSQLQVVFTKISVNIRRRERIILEQKNTSVSLALQLIVKAQSTLKALVSGSNLTNNISTSANGLLVFNLVKSLNALLPDLGNPYIKVALHIFLPDSYHYPNCLYL